MNDPISLFQTWLREELEQSNLKIPTAVCLSTIGLDGFPNARFLSLKEVRGGSFIITGPLKSRKGLEIKENHKVALTFWWTETERQVRIQGTANEIPSDLASQYFKERNRTSQAVSELSNQGEQIDNIDSLENKIQVLADSDSIISKSDDWGGFSIEPIRIEFLEFRSTRFHERKLYKRSGKFWKMSHLQP
ncbi:MAG: pyridoxal 5'-phosphate synthase [Bacteroidota bacterium]